LHHEGMFKVGVTLTYYRGSLPGLQGSFFESSAIALV